MRSTTIRLTSALALSFLGSALASADERSVLDQCFALTRESKFTEAEPLCVSARETGGEIGTLVYGDFLVAKGDARAAVVEYSELLKNVGEDTAPTELQQVALRRRAIAHVRNSDTYGALADAERLLRVLPDDIELLEFLSCNRLTASTQLQAAEQLLRLRPDHLPYHMTKIRALLAGKENEAALAAAQTALKVDSSSLVALSHRGFAHAALGDYEKAERDHATVARKAPNEPDPKANRAEMLILLSRFDDAAKVATEALSIRSDHPRALHVRATARLRMGDGEGALADIHAGMMSDDDELFSSEDADRARALINAQAMLTPQSVVAMDRDYNAVLGVISSDLHNRCGRYVVNDYSTNEELDEYRDCIVKWYETEDDEFVRAFSREMQTIGETLVKKLQNLKAAEQFLCSKMPKKSRCIDDASYAHLDTLRASLADPVVTVGDAEFERLNREVDARNAKDQRVQALVKTANFFDALSRALSEQQ